MRGGVCQRADDDPGNVFIRRGSVQTLAQRHGHQAEMRDGLKRRHVIVDEKSGVDRYDVKTWRPFEYLVAKPLLAGMHRRMDRVGDP